MPVAIVPILSTYGVRPVSNGRGVFRRTTTTEHRPRSPAVPMHVSVHLSDEEAKDPAKSPRRAQRNSKHDEDDAREVQRNGVKATFNSRGNAPCSKIRLRAEGRDSEGSRRGTRRTRRTRGSQARMTPRKRAPREIFRPFFFGEGDAGAPISSFYPISNRCKNRS